jgi:uncharacterized protein
VEFLTDEQIKEIVNRLVYGVHPEKIFLFGSHANGTSRQESDIDVLLVIHDTNQSHQEIYGEAEKCLRGTRLPVELVICTHTEFEEQKNWVSSLPYNILKKGKLLYAA